MATERRREVRYPARLTARVGYRLLASLERPADAEGRPLGEIVREVLEEGAPRVARRYEGYRRRAAERARITARASSTSARATA